MSFHPKIVGPPIEICLRKDSSRHSAILNRLDHLAIFFKDSDDDLQAEIARRIGLYNMTAQTANYCKYLAINADQADIRIGDIHTSSEVRIYGYDGLQKGSPAWGVSLGKVPKPDLKRRMIFGSELHLFKLTTSLLGRLNNPIDNLVIAIYLKMR